MFLFNDVSWAWDFYSTKGNSVKNRKFQAPPDAVALRSKHLWNFVWNKTLSNSQTLHFNLYSFMFVLFYSKKLAERCFLFVRFIFIDKYSHLRRPENSAKFKEEIKQQRKTVNSEWLPWHFKTHLRWSFATGTEEGSIWKWIPTIFKPHHFNLFLAYLLLLQVKRALIKTFC